MNRALTLAACLATLLPATLRADRREPANNDEVAIDSEDGERYLNPVYLLSVSGAPLVTKDRTPVAA